MAGLILAYGIATGKFPLSSQTSLLLFLKLLQLLYLLGEYFIG